MINEKQSNSLYVIRAFAILSVILAHMPFGQEHALAETIRIAFGQIGVAVFFIVSGFFYNRKKGDTKEFWIKKLKNVVVPWLIISTITYIVSCLLAGSLAFSLISVIKWIFGIQNWYWYLPVLLILFALFKFIKNDSLLYVCLAVTVASVLLSAFGIIRYNTYFNQHFNILNWVGFFALGIVIRKKNAVSKFEGIIPLIISLVVLAISIILSVKFGLNKAYIDYFSILCELSGFVFLLNLSYLLSNIGFLKDIGKKSFFIYLIQMQIAGIVNTRLPYNAFFFILRPFVALALIYVICLIIDFVLKKTKLDKFGYLIAIR